MYKFSFIHSLPPSLYPPPSLCVFLYLSFSPSLSPSGDGGEVMLNVLRCQLTYWGQVVTNAEARFSNSLSPWKPEGSLGRTAQDGHLNSHTAPGLCVCVPLCISFITLILSLPVSPSLSPPSNLHHPLSPSVPPPTPPSLCLHHPVSPLPPPPNLCLHLPVSPSVSLSLHHPVSPSVSLSLCPPFPHPQSIFARRDSGGGCEGLLTTGPTPSLSLPGETAEVGVRNC